MGDTLTAGVATWALSPTKFQVDMGVLLAFMFVWTMVGAVLLIPALSYFLLHSVRVRRVSPAVGLQHAWIEDAGHVHVMLRRLQ